MKKLLFSVCAATLLLFSACSKDDDKNVSEMSVTEMNSMIIGSWNFDHEDWWESDGDHGTEYGGEERLTFNSDGTYIELLEDDRYTGTYWITNKKELIMRNENSYYSYNDTLIIETLTKTDLIMLLGDDDYGHKYYYKK